MNKRENLHLREERRVRHNKIWAVLRFILAYNDLLAASDFISFNKNIANYENAKADLKQYSPDNNSFQVAFRFCRREFYYGECDSELTDANMQDLMNWETTTIDIHKILNDIIVSYEDYWENVIVSYKRQSARTKRYQYLVDNLDEVLKSSYIREFPDIMQKVEDLQNEYRSRI